MDKFVYWESLFTKLVKFNIIILSILIFKKYFLNSLRDYLKLQPKYKDKPIDSYVQVIMITMWIYAFISFILILFDTTRRLSYYFGSVSAVII